MRYDPVLSTIFQHGAYLRRHMQEVPTDREHSILPYLVPDVLVIEVDRCNASDFERGVEHMFRTIG